MQSLAYFDISAAARQRLAVVRFEQGALVVLKHTSKTPTDRLSVCVVLQIIASCFCPTTIIPRHRSIYSFTWIYRREADLKSGRSMKFCVRPRLYGENLNKKTEAKQARSQEFQWA